MKALIALLLTSLILSSCSTGPTDEQIEATVNARLTAAAPTAPPIPPTDTPEPQPTNTPLPTDTPQPPNTPSPTETPIPPTDTPTPIGTIRVDHWLFEITEVHSDPGRDATRQQVVLLGNLTNEGTSTDTFVAFGTLMLKDSQGRRYEDDQVGTFAAEDKYGTEIPAGMSPGATVYIAIAFDTPSSEKTFTIVPGDLVVGWSGDITFTLP